MDEFIKLAKDYWYNSRDLELRVVVRGYPECPYPNVYYYIKEEFHDDAPKVIAQGRDLRDLVRKARVSLNADIALSYWREYDSRKGNIG